MNALEILGKFCLNSSISLPVNAYMSTDAAALQSFFFPLSFFLRRCKLHFKVCKDTESASSVFPLSDCVNA